MSRRKRNLRAFLHQNPDATVEQAWDAAWEGAQKRYHSKTMNDLQQQLAALREAVDEVLNASVSSLEYRSNRLQLAMWGLRAVRDKALLKQEGE